MAAGIRASRGPARVMNDWPASIVIVGGGTAGWLAALILGDVAKRRKAPCAITVVESSRIGTIGVGEGTTAVFRQMLRHLGIDEMEFLRETGATIKYGIRHQDWRRLGHSYDGPIDDPGQVAGPGLDTYAVASGRPVGAAHLFQHLIDRSRAPFARKGGRLVPAGPFHHAYHFDQALAGAFLRGKAEGVTVIDDQVTGVETGDGRIARIVLESGRKVEGDFFLDCSGFRRALIGELGAEWVSYGDVLPVNRAMPFWVDLEARRGDRAGHIGPRDEIRLDVAHTDARAVWLRLRLFRRAHVARRGARPRSRRRWAMPSNPATTSGSTRAACARPGSATASRWGSPPRFSNRWKPRRSTARSCS